MYKVRWRLIYPLHPDLDEKVEGSSIRDAWAGPVEIHLFDLSGAAFRRVSIPRGYKPVFYRCRSMALNAAGSIQTDAIVWGYARHGVQNIEGMVWLWKGGKDFDCPPEYFDQVAIETLVS